MSQSSGTSKLLPTEKMTAPELPYTDGMADSIRAHLLTLRIIGTIGALIGIIGLVATASAEAPPRPGFPPGSRTFSNPFANPPAGAPTGDDFGDDYEEDGDFAPPPTSGNPMGGFTPPGGAGGTGGGRGASPGVSVGGGTPSGVIENRKVQDVAINTETGEGSKEVVTDFNFPDADIMDIAKALGKLTGKNFILDKDVKGRITIISNSPITVGDAWKAFLTALDINGFALIPSGKYIRIARQRDARDKQLKTYTGEFSPDTDALITRVFPLKYINAEEVARTFRSFMPANSRIIPYEQTNTVIVTDTGSNIAKLNKMLEILDVEGYDAGIEVISVKFASATELSKLIDQLLPGTGGAAGAPGGAPRFGGNRFSARRTKEGGIINTIIADDRTNNLIVHANSKGAGQVRELVAKLDQKIPAAQGGRVHVVYLQFAEAEAIANTLNNLGQSAAAPRPAGGPGGTGVNPVNASLFEGNIKVAPDKATNSLVVTASPADFSTVQRVIQRLDIPRDEVYVEVVIMEVGLDKNFEYSTNAAVPPIFFTPNQDLLNWVLNPVGQSGAVIGFRSGSQNLAINGQNVQIPNQAALIKAIQTNSRTNILATPQIIALDNTEATFESTENIPILTQTAVQNVGITSVPGKQPITLSVQIKPQINRITNYVKMDITTKLGDISDRQPPAAVQGQAFATLERMAKTSVFVADSDTIILGGLIRDRMSQTTRKIPILGDIPLLGWLFRARTEQATKSNLLIFLTPHIVRKYDKLRTILDKKLKERDDFLEKHAGGEDSLRETRDDIIRGLPDIKEIMANQPETAVSIDPTDSSAGGLSEAPPAAQAVPPNPATNPLTPPPPATELNSGLAPLPPPMEFPSEPPPSDFSPQGFPTPGN
jgi:general secretion pathway protein D